MHSNVCTARLSWTAPASHMDGTPITESLGYNIYWGTSSGDYPNKMDNGQGTQGAVTGLAPGVYYFAVTAYLADSPTNESGFSSEASWGQAPNFIKHELYGPSEVHASKVILK